jgi:hypothetical protein
VSNKQPEENLLNSIASTVEEIRDRMTAVETRMVIREDLVDFATKGDLSSFATKEDLNRFATKEDLSHFATKEDLDRFATKEDLSRFATKDDFDSLREQVEFIGGELESIRDRMATKEDLARVEARLTDKIEVETTVLRGDIEQVHLRLDGIDKALTARLNQLETEMSRLRSVVYLLVKDKPDMLRLLGQTPPTGG